MIGSDLPIQEKYSKGPIRGRLVLAIKTFYAKLLCFLGFHKWTLCSALKGKPKYLCRECNKYSKKVWKE